jgi:hypothetical protein
MQCNMLRSFSGRREQQVLPMRATGDWIMDELIAVMMSWAVTLSGYPAPAMLPQVRMVPHAVLMAQACGGQPCNVLGWFPPGEMIYLDDRLDLEGNLVADSILVHEMVHYLQQQAREREVRQEPMMQTAMRHPTCTSNVDAERQAYQAQREYLVRYGVFQTVGFGMSSSHC